MDLHSPAAEKVNSPVKEALLSTAVSDSAPSTTPGRDVAAEEDGTKTSSPKKGTAFWMIMVSIMITTFLSALDLTAVSTALPSESETKALLTVGDFYFNLLIFGNHCSAIAYDLKSEDFTWIGSAYALSSTAFRMLSRLPFVRRLMLFSPAVPVFGGLAEVFGRKPNLLAAITIFAVGSAVCGSATSATAMIVGRTIQGVGVSLFRCLGTQRNFVLITAVARVVAFSHLSKLSLRIWSHLLSEDSTLASSAWSGLSLRLSVRESGASSTIWDVR